MRAGVLPAVLTAPQVADRCKLARCCNSCNRTLLLPAAHQFQMTNAQTRYTMMSTSRLRFRRSQHAGVSTAAITTVLKPARRKLQHRPHSIRMMPSLTVGRAEAP